MNKDQRSILIIAAMILGALGALGFIVSKALKKGKSSFLSIVSKCLIAIGIFLLALAIYFLNLDSN